MARIEFLRLSESLGSDYELVDVRRPVLDMVVTDQLQEALELRRAPKLRGIKNAMNLFPLILKRHPGVRNQVRGPPINELKSGY
jgi:hypothetical protein